MNKKECQVKIDEKWFYCHLTEDEIQLIYDDMRGGIGWEYTISVDNGDIVEIGIIYDIYIENKRSKPLDNDEICRRAWSLYRSPEKEDIANYSKYDALYDITKSMDITDEEYDILLEEMSHE